MLVFTVSFGIWFDCCLLVVDGIPWCTFLLGVPLGLYASWFGVVVCDLLVAVCFVVLWVVYCVYL